MEIYSILTALSLCSLLQYYNLVPYLAEAAPTNINTDRSALLAFKSQLNLDSSHILSTNWSESFPVCSWIGVRCGFRHQRVVVLNVTRMGLSGNIPPQLGNLSFLVSLNLSRNNFQGNIPQELIRLRRLRDLNLRLNNISGEVPSWLGSFPKLQVLLLRNNTFTGVLPPSLSNMSNLRVLEVAFNNLQGRIPQEIGYLQNLHVLDLQGNQLTGSIPAMLFNSQKLKVLALSYNRLQGSIPREVSNLTILEELYLNNNQLTGEVLNNLLNISTMRVLSLRENGYLSGIIPSNFGYSLSNIEKLDILGNNFTSESPELSFITSLTNCRSLDRLSLSNNPLNGRIPSSVGNFSTSLNYFYAYSCGLDGSIPEQIGNLSNLIALALFDNQLTGSLPETLGNLQNLQALDVARNRIDGTIPKTFCSFLYLFVLTLNGNQIGNSIPDCLGNLTSLRSLQLGNNRLNSTIPTKLWHLTDLRELDLASNFFVGSLAPEIGNLEAATQIHLSNNQLSGIIPSTIGELTALETFLLAQNNFQGSIPESIGKMVNLEGLDLSQNSLSGPIPASIEKLQYLVYFNVSFNDLSGEIPSDGPFRNFTSQFFMSNERLCGGAKYNVPPCKSSKSKSKIRIILILVGTLGVVFSMTAIACAFARYKGKKDEHVTSSNWSGPMPMRFSYDELREATDGYCESNLLGCGSFGSVYKGTLRSGKDVAIKVFNLQSELASNSFEAECEVLRKLRHKNLCKVIGACSNQDFKALILEYMPNGSLEKWLYSHNYFLDVIQRINIMIEIAFALEYLHYGYAATPIIHCDIKPSNVLLNENMEGHLCDFGIAKLLKDGESAMHTLTLATIGYIAPEFGLEGLVSTRCDVYSYGIMLMEVFTRMKPNDEKFAGNFNLRRLVKESIPDGIIHIIDANLLRPDENFFKEKLNSLSSIFELALCCTKDSSTDRINIIDVRVALQKIKNQILDCYQWGSKK